MRWPLRCAQDKSKLNLSRTEEYSIDGRELLDTDQNILCQRQSLGVGLSPHPMLKAFGLPLALNGKDQ